MTKLFVGGLPYSTTSDQLKQMFAPFGAVLSAAVITDKFTGQSKGFGFVEMENDEEAQKSIQELNGTNMDGRTVGVSVARPKEDRPRDGGGFNRGGGFGGGFGGGGFDRGGRDSRGGGRGGRR